jgi:hypothetical protein
MGQCWYYSGTSDEPDQCVDVKGPWDCSGNYVDTPDACPVVLVNGCPFFNTELISYVNAKSGDDPVIAAAAHPGVLVASDFSKLILPHSVLGREAKELYAAHARTAVEGLRKRPRLLARALRLVITGIILAQDMLRAHFYKGAGALKLQNTTVREALEVARELGKLIHTKEFDHLVSRVEWFFKQIDGMTTKQILEHLAVETPR